ncbi:MAG: DUF262 domain-containing protein [Acidimicrobiia bacterium]|nr:DUF262 domain-containing protein [Acidimicrobiia bacterium]
MIANKEPRRINSKIGAFPQDRCSCPDKGGLVRRETSEWTVRMLTDLHGRINTEAEYQRGKVWSVPQQQLLIDSILRGFDLPKIFLRKLPDGSDKLFDVVDGVQRLTAIWQFMSNEYALPRSYSYPDLETVGGKNWGELPQNAKDRLEFAKVTVTELETENEDDIRELFQRLQKGEPLNAAERRNAMSSPVRNFVSDKMGKHPLWPETALRSKRFGWHEMSAIILALVKENGPTGLKGADLLALYEDDSFEPQGPVALRAMDMLDRLQAIAATERGTLKTRWGVVDLLLSLMKLEESDIYPDPKTVLRFFEEFEQERREGAIELSDLRSTVIGLAADEPSEEELELPAIAPDMLTYLNAFAREGAIKANVETRSKVMEDRLRQHLQEQS